MSPETAHQGKLLLLSFTATATTSHFLARWRGWRRLLVCLIVSVGVTELWQWSGFSP